MLDNSGRLDVSQVHPWDAEDYAWAMFCAVTEVSPVKCRKLHLDLNQKPEMYQAALDLFKALCKKHGVKRCSEHWGEYLKP